MRWPSWSPWPKATAPAAIDCAVLNRLLMTLGCAYRAAQVTGKTSRYAPMKAMTGEKTKGSTTWNSSDWSTPPTELPPTTTLAVPAPARPPTRACVDDDGMPRHHSNRPQTQALASPAARMVRPLSPRGGSPRSG